MSLIDSKNDRGGKKKVSVRGGTYGLGSHCCWCYIPTSTKNDEVKYKSSEARYIYIYIYVNVRFLVPQPRWNSRTWFTYA